MLYYAQSKPVADQDSAVQNPIAAHRFVYEKPTLQRLGLLRLMTRFSIAGEDDHKKPKKHGND